MFNLILAAVFFVGLHVLISGTSRRDRLIERFGMLAFRAGFATLALLGLIWLAYAWRGAPYIETWGQLTAIKPLIAVLMLPAFVLIVCGVSSPNPTAVTGETLLAGDPEVRGILRVSRHPFLWGIGLWAALHLIVNGDVAALILFGSLLGLVVAGTRSIDAKRQRAFGEHWTRFAAQTSALPFQAMCDGRQPRDWRTLLAEIGWPRLAVTLVVYLGVMHLHTRLLGVSPLF
jgi:uncharacterized membrane protein